MSFSTETWMFPAVVLSMACVSTLFVLLYGHVFAHRYGLIDQPNQRKKHLSPTPLHGGLAIFLGLFMMGCFFSNPSILLAGFVLLMMGMLDDIQPRSAFLRLLIQTFAALIVVVSGVQIISFGRLWSSELVLLGDYGFWTSLFALVGVMNAFNMLDGVDGLAASMAAIILAAFSLVSGVFLVDYLVIIPLLGLFLSQNFRFISQKPAKVFLGDSGSMLLGLLVGCAAIHLSQLPWSEMGQDAATQSWLVPVNVLWFMAIPLFDTGQVMIRRVLSGRSPFSPGRDHTHLICIDRGLGAFKTVGLLTLSQTLCCVLSTVLLIYGCPESWLFYGFLLCFALYYWRIGQLLAANQMPQHVSEGPYE